MAGSYGRFIFNLKKKDLFTYFRVRVSGRRGRGRGKEAQAEFPLSVEPDVGLVSRPWDHDLSGNQELDP